ncbi:MAG: archaeal ATPase-like protein [Thermoleophilia bacterium]|nr:archaeal ATPase-like protein [Thermoleophilia bacterium]
MPAFIGRQAQLDQLDTALRSARAGTGAFVWMTGRRRIGKSRLVEEFLSRATHPSVFFQAPSGTHRDGLADFVAAVRASPLPAARTFDNVTPANWRGALELAATGATREHPVIIVIDEFPYLHEADDGIDADFQHSWDRELERLPIMLVCIGSDLAMMERMLEPQRPLHGRPTHVINVPPLTPHDVATMIDLDPADAIDAYLVVGGFPLLARQWRGGISPIAFVRQQLIDTMQPLVVNGERIVHAELPTDANARAVLMAIGSGQRTYSKVLNRLEGISAKTFERSLDLLREKRIIEKLTPVSVPLSKESHYVVCDPHLRFWLRFIGPYLGELERGRGDLAIARVERDWSTFRGTSVEPIVRAGISRLLVTERYGDCSDVGAYWNRSGTVEIDLVGVDSLAKPTRVGFAGSIKWRGDTPFDARDSTALANHRAHLPGATNDTILVGVSRAGFDRANVDVQLGPADIIEAFAP